MIVFPAIDLKDGKAVRLKQGDYSQVTSYSDDPIALVRQWKDQGAEWIHVVDLDAAKAGRPVHLELISQMAREAGAVHLQVGGGIRTVEAAGAYFDKNISRVVVGTKAVQDPDFLKGLSETFPRRVALGLDTKDGKIAVQGWTETTELTIREYLRQAPLEHVHSLIFTDIARDGMLSGPNLEALREVLSSTELPVIASGGISSLEDIRALAEMEDCKLLGVITGKALYEGKFTLQEAIHYAH
ncbi:MAG TPA: 1-(5-phosphoribosyl)-5-[(5-phosphoribosylamino)methylideneamino]imidazole-4-carboxamide isomerase [Deltaproteobacteria bacterium]|nr:1-(5-phosphoribosyl)-5-[(5-phosphoribosylamino)methylideneamino]imidazole-4-carboxamide isomerase [Deltaproteobacteria bacterium]